MMKSDMNVPNELKVRYIVGHELVIPLLAEDKVCKKVTDEVFYDDVIVERNVPLLTFTIDLAKVLGLGIDKLQARLNVVEGEMVDVGDLVASRPSGLAGMFLHEITTPVKGIINLRQIDKGLLSIQSLERSNLSIKGVNGRVKRIIPGKRLELSGDFASIDTFYTNIRNEVFGNLVIISSKKELKEGNPKLDKKNLGNIVFIDDLIDLSIIEKAEALNITCLVAPGIDADELFGSLYNVDQLEQKYKVRIVVLEGFGIGRLHKKTLEIFRINEGMMVDIKGNVFAVSSKKVAVTSKVKYYSTLKKGNQVRIYSDTNWGAYGEVISVPQKGGLDVEVLVDKVDCKVNIYNLVKVI